MFHFNYYFCHNCSLFKVTHFNDIKLQQLQVIHFLFIALPFFKKKYSSTDINIIILILKYNYT